MRKLAAVGVAVLEELQVGHLVVDDLHQDRENLSCQVTFHATAVGLAQSRNNPGNVLYAGDPAAVT